MLTGINHITLAVSNLSKSLHFYIELLGMTPKARWQSGAYLTVGELWICLSVDEVSPSKDYSHIAFNINEKDFKAFSQKLIHAGVKTWKNNVSEGASIYMLDPDGHKLEAHVGDLQSRLEELKTKPYKDLEWH